MEKKLLLFHSVFGSIDSYIQRLDEVVDCATIAIEDDVRENILAAFIVLEREMTKDDLLEKLQVILPEYQLPEYIEIVDSFPLNNSGKICKKTLKMNFIKHHR